MYIKYNSKNYPLADDNTSLEDVIKVIEQKNKDILNEFDIKGTNYQIRNGEYGYYISYKKGSKMQFVSIPKNKNIDSLEEKDILEIVATKYKKRSKKTIKNTLTSN